MLRGTSVCLSSSALLERSSGVHWWAYQRTTKAADNLDRFVIPFVIYLRINSPSVSGSLPRLWYAKWWAVTTISLRSKRSCWQTLSQHEVGHGR